MRNIFIICCFIFSINTSVSAQIGYLEIDGIEGDSNINTFKNWISIESFNLGIKLKAQVPGRGRMTTPTNENVTITKHIDRSTISLMKAVKSGKLFNKVVIVIPLENSSNKLIQYTFSKLRFSDYDVLVDPETQLETLKLSYDTVTIKFTEKLTNGSAIEQKEVFDFGGQS